MKRPVLWMSLLGLLCGSLAFGQGKVEPTLVGDVRTNEFDFILVGTNTMEYQDTVPTNRMWLSAQHIFDSIDATFELVLDLDTDAWVVLSPTADTTQATFDFLDGYLATNVSFSTNGWVWLAPTAATAQATWNWLDAWGAYAFTNFDTNTYAMPGSNIVGATLVSNQWTGLMPGTNIQWSTFDTNTLTWSQFNYQTNYWGSLVVAGTSSNNPIFTNGAADVYMPVDDEISLVWDPGDWYDEATYTTTLPVDGTYLFTLYAWGNKCNVQAAATNSHNPSGTFTLGVGNWYTDMTNSGAMAKQQWTHISAYPSNTTFKWIVRSDSELSAATNIQMASFSVILIAPYRQAWGPDPD